MLSLFLLFFCFVPPCVGTRQSEVRRSWKVAKPFLYSIAGLLASLGCTQARRLVCNRRSLIPAFALVSLSDAGEDPNEFAWNRLTGKDAT